MIPEGFHVHERKSPVTAPWEPIFARDQSQSFTLALRIAEAHCNGRGFLHGGVIAALADNAMGLTVVRAHAGPASAVTVSLNIDYVGIGQIGQWMEVTPRLIKTGKSLAFVDALITADSEIIARASATFKKV